MKPPAAISITMLATLALPAFAEGTPPPPPEPLRIEVAEAALKFQIIAEETYFSMAALQEFALLVQPRALSILRAGSDTPEPATTLLEIPEEIDYFGASRAVGDHIFISVGSYEEERRRRESATPRGGFVGGPKPIGILMISAAPPSVRWIKSCRVVHWPEPGEIDRDIAGPPPEFIIPAMQDARLIDDKLYIADYGRLGILDLGDETWHGLDNDWSMRFNRIGPVKDPGGRLFIGCDEGGAAGGFIKWLDGPSQGDLSLNPAFAPGQILGLGGRIFLTTDMGLAEITDPGGTPVVRHFVDQQGKSPISEAFALARHRDTLLVAAVNSILHLDPAKRSATIHRPPPGTEIYRLCHFHGHIYALGPENLLRFTVP